MNKIKLNKDEEEILESFEQGEWKSVQNVKAEIMKHQQYARNTLKKDKRVNIRISSKVLEEIQTLAVENGIPYQTLMSSVLHRYVSGYLIEKPRPNKSLERTGNAGQTKAA
ncbi:MAG: antitoxin [Desulfobacterales bacterium]|nr:antitoxin [Desulfobacterales bacterium]